MSYHLSFPKLLAKSRTDKIHDEFGLTPEDWRYNDRSAISELDLSETMKKTDWELRNDMWNLMSWTSMGELQIIARRVFNQFIYYRGGTFSDETLNKIVRNHSDIRDWTDKFIKNFELDLKRYKGNIDMLTATQPNRPNFSKTWDCFGGLGILIHQVWAYEIWLNNFTFDPRTGSYSGNLQIKFYDHFGLDREDVKKGNQRWLQPYGSEDGFKAWWVLQHYRGCKPLLMEITFNKLLLGKVGLNY